jgi:hypothetical protein
MDIKEQLDHMIKTYGMKKILTGLIDILNDQLKEDLTEKTYLISLKYNLVRALSKYEDRYK